MRSSKRDAAGVFGRSRELFEQVVAGWRTAAMPRPPPHMVVGQLRTDTIRSLRKSRTHKNLRGMRQVGERLGIHGALDARARLAAGERRWDRAVRLAAAAASLTARSQR